MTRNKTTISVKILCGYKCNQCCSYCDAPKDEDADFTAFQEADKIISLLKDYPGFYIQLDGGEALEYPDTISWALKYGVPTYIFTNGTQITQELLDKCSKNAIFRVSLDGPEDLHITQKIRKDGSNSYQQTVNGVNLLRKNGFHFILAATITEKTIPRLEECRKLLTSFEPDRVILTTQMFLDDPLREKTKAIYDKVAPTIEGWQDEMITFGSFHSPKRLDQNLIELLFKHDRIEVNIEGFDTPTLKKYSYLEIDQLIGGLKSANNRI